MVYYNDVLYACMKRVYGHDNMMGATKVLMKEEARAKRKLEKLKKKVIFRTFIMVINIIDGIQEK